MANVLTKEECYNSRQLYTQALSLGDDVVTGYATVILAMLDTIDDLREALLIANKEGKYAPNSWRNEAR